MLKFLGKHEKFFSDNDKQYRLNFKKEEKSFITECKNNFREEADQLVVDLKKTAGKIVDMVPISTQFTLNTICGE